MITQELRSPTFIHSAIHSVLQFSYFSQHHTDDDSEWHMNKMTQANEDGVQYKFK